MDDPTPMQLYLGCIQKRCEGDIDGKCPAVGIDYDMESLLASCVQRYLKLCEPNSAPTGASKPIKKLYNKQKKAAATDDLPDVDPSKYLTVVATPFLNDSDQKESPHGAPCYDPNHPDPVTCPW